MENGELYLNGVDGGTEVRRWPGHQLVSTHASREEAKRLVLLGNEELYAKRQQRITETVSQIDKLFRNHSKIVSDEVNKLFPSTNNIRSEQ